MTLIRQRAQELLDQIPSVPVRSNDSNRDYQRFTGGLEHSTMADNWKKGGIMTGCNAFVGWYAQQLGSTKYLGRFDLPTYLPKIGKGHAWIKSAEGRRPENGDILLHTGLHVDVAIGFAGKILHRMAAGQGGRSMGCDVLKRCEGKADFDWKNLQGWIDLDMYFGPDPAANPSPNWLPGWWKVSWRGDPYYYYFDEAASVRWTPNPPGNISQPPAASHDSGSVSMLASAGVAVRWRTSGSVEKFVLLPAVGGMQMRGTWNGAEPLAAVRL
jgi:hypothetical protein